MSRLLHRFFVEQSSGVLVQFVRYVITGGIAFAADLGVLCSLHHLLGVNYLIAAALAFIVGLGVNYFISIRWVFSQRTVENRHAEFLIFMAIGAVGLAANEYIIYHSVEALGQPLAVAKIISTAIVLVWNFVARKLILFTKNE